MIMRWALPELMYRLVHGHHPKSTDLQDFPLFPGSKPEGWHKWTIGDYKYSDERLFF